MTPEVPKTQSTLIAVPPPYPDVETSREATRRKLARNTAALFGIPVPGSLHPGHQWLSDYNALSNTDLAEGTPPGWGSLDVTPLASATLSKFGPDVKAAAVLAGVEELLAPLRRDMQAVLRITALSEDERPVADVTRLAIWASLQLDVMLAQPALMIAAYQARTIQRATDTCWSMQVESQPPARSKKGKTGKRSARQVEFGLRRTSRADETLEPRSIEILDDLMWNDVQPSIGPGADNEEDITQLVDNAITRWVSHVMRDTAYVGWGKVRGETLGQRRLDVYLHSQGLNSTYMDENLRVFRMIQPYGTDSGEWVGFDHEDLTHWQRILPRIPGKFEIRHLDVSIQVSMIRALRNVLRCVTELKDKLPTEVNRLVRRRFLDLHSLSEAILGPEHPESLRTFCHYADNLLRSLEFSQSPSDWDLYADRPSVDRAAVDAVVRLSDQRGGWLPGEWLECWDQMSTCVSRIYSRLQRDPSTREEADNLAAMQSQGWAEAFAGLGLDIFGEDLKTLRQTTRGLATPLHNWLVPALRPSRPAEQVRRAREVGLEVILSLRTEEAQERKSDRPLRFTLQVLSGATARALETDSQDGRGDLVSTLRALRRQLSDTARVKFIKEILEGPRDRFGQLTTSDFITLTRLIHAAIALVTFGSDDPSFYPETDSYLNACRSILDAHQSTPAVATMREEDLRRLETDWQTASANT